MPDPRPLRLDPPEGARIWQPRGADAEALHTHAGAEQGAWIEVAAASGARSAWELLLRDRLAPVLHRAAPGDSTSRRSVTLCAPVPARDRLPVLVTGLMRLGVASWIPLLTARADRRRLDLLEGVVAGGVQGTLRIEPPRDLPSALEREDLVWCTPEGDAAPAATASATLLVGPEGGFDPEERHALEAACLRKWSLGPDVLRLEVAALNAVAACL